MNRSVTLMQVLGVCLALIGLGRAAEPNADQAKAVTEIQRFGGKPSTHGKNLGEPLCSFTAKVKWIDVIGMREGKAVPIGTQFEMNWLVGIEILSIEKPGKAFDKKGEQILLIHSPALFFWHPAEEVIGKRYSFRVFGEMKGNTLRYTSAEVEEKESPKKKRP